MMEKQGKERFTVFLNVYFLPFYKKTCKSNLANNIIP